MSRHRMGLNPLPQDYEKSVLTSRLSWVWYIPNALKHFFAKTLQNQYFTFSPSAISASMQYSTGLNVSNLQKYEHCEATQQSRFKTCLKIILELNSSKTFNLFLCYN